MRFHEAVGAASGNRILAESLLSLNNLQVETRRVVSLPGRLRRMIPNTMPWLRRFWHAMQRQPPAMFAHVRRVAEEVEPWPSNAMSNEVMTLAEFAGAMPHPGSAVARAGLLSSVDMSSPNRRVARSVHQRTMGPIGYGQAVNNSSVLFKCCLLSRCCLSIRRCPGIGRPNTGRIAIRPRLAGGR